MKKIVLAGLAGLLWTGVAQAAFSPPSTWSFIGVAIGYGADPSCSGQAGCNSLQPQFSFLSGPAQLFPPLSATATAQGRYAISSSLSPLNDIFSVPQFRPYRLSSDLSGPYTATLTPVSQPSAGDDLRFAVATDRGPLRLQAGSGTFEFAAVPGTTYYALAYGAVGTPLQYRLDIAPVPLPGALLPFLTGLGVLGWLRRRA